MSLPQDILKRRALEYHSQPDRGPSCGNMAVDMALILEGLVTFAPDSRLQLTDAGHAFLLESPSHD